MTNTVQDALTAGKKLIGFGAGLNLYQSQAGGRLPLAYAIDDTPGLAGTLADGVPVFGSQHLANEKPEDVAVIIYADAPGNIAKMAARLTQFGIYTFIESFRLHVESMAPRMEQYLGFQPSRERFEEIRKSRECVPSISFVAGSWLYVEMLENLVSRVTGDIAECGVYKGGNAMLTLRNSATACNRTYHLLDSFEGFPSLSGEDPAVRSRDFRDVDFESIVSAFEPFPNVEIHRGFFDETLPQLEPRTYGMVYIDCDLYEPTLDLCRYFYPRLSPGGCLLFHDYWFPKIDPPHQTAFRGIARAAGEFFSEDDVSRIIGFPETTHAVLIKR